jgi:hypothetical protein
MGYPDAMNRDSDPKSLEGRLEGSWEERQRVATAIFQQQSLLLSEKREGGKWSGRKEPVKSRSDVTTLHQTDTHGRVRDDEREAQVVR